MKQLQPGDHICCDRGLCHCYARQKCREKRKSNGEIARACLDCFLDSAPLEIIESRSKPAHEVIKTATDFLENGGFGRYNFLSNNCKHFANYCRTGSAFSTRTDNVVATAVDTAVHGPIGKQAWRNVWSVLRVFERVNTTRLML
ncbi:hypothetical protein PTKIN_Ptkin01aG0344800 [Pterospermum kingtungense]